MTYITNDSNKKEVMSPPGRDASFRNGMDGKQARPEEITCESESLSLRLQQLN